MQSMICGYCTRLLIRGVRIRVHPPSLILVLIIARWRKDFNYTECIFKNQIYIKKFLSVTSAQKSGGKSAMIAPYEQETGGAFYGKETGAGFPKRVCGLRVLYEGMPAKGDFDSPGRVCGD